MPTVSKAERKRLDDFFGERGAQVIVQNFDNLDQVFGSAATIIRLVLEGKMSSDQRKNKW